LHSPIEYKFFERNDGQVQKIFDACRLQQPLSIQGYAETNVLIEVATFM